MIYERQAMRHAVLLAVGKYSDEKAGFSSQEGPRTEFCEIAHFLKADIHSYVSAIAERGPWFQSIFRTRQLWGSALNIVIRRNQYDRIYVTGEDIGFRAALLLRLVGWRGKMVCLVHNMTRSRKWLLGLIGHRLFNSLVVVSKSQISPILKAGFPESKITHVFNWVDEEFFSPLEPTGKDTNDITFVACGAENRDYVTLAQAAQLVPGHTYVFGHGFFGPATQTASREGNLIPMPRVSFEELRRYYGLATAIVVPLNAVPYAAGVTGLVEAMSMGRPVIVTRSAGIEEYCGGIPESLLVQPHEHIQLSKAMQQVTSNPNAYSRFGISNREWICKNCSLSNYVRIIASLMER
jgi:glycosyltransferase involved in cell wall biosynthesis